MAVAAVVSSGAAPDLQYDWVIYLWQPDDETLTPLSALIEASSIEDMQFSPDGSLIMPLLQGADKVGLWRVDNLEHLIDLDITKLVDEPLVAAARRRLASIDRMVMSPDGRMIVTCLEGGVLLFWGIR